jgi:6-pyruvoyltetrahydropterin/6-carboxytetrahydropterin synthase
VLPAAAFLAYSPLLKPLKKLSKMLSYLSRKTHFNAAHRMYREEWSTEKNLEVFGKCANPNYHGHNYTLLVTVKGQVTTSTAYLMDVKVLNAIMDQEVVEKLDHKNLNLDVDFMQGKMATTELLCISIFNQLKRPIEAHPGVFLHAVKLNETENNSVEYFGG